MREEIEDKADSAPDAASLARIRVRRPKEAEPAPRKVKSGDITDRLQALASELEATRPAATAAAPATVTPARGRKAPVDAAALRAVPKAPRARKAALKAPPKPRHKPVIDAGTGASPATVADATASAPIPRLLFRPRPAATGGWQRKVATPDILSYWMDIRDGKRYPDWRDLDTGLIGRHWPNCTLVHCNHALGRMQIENGFVSAVRHAALADNPDRDLSTDVEFSPMVIDWVLSFAREVATSGKPAHGTEYFPATFDEMTLRVIALPLSENQIDIDHVLCYVQKLD